MLEKTQQNQIEPSAWATLYKRWKSLVSAQLQVFGLILVCLVWSVIGLPGLGQHGLWDPWEMDRTYVARQMTESPRVLVVENSEKPGEFGPVGQWLVMRYGDMLHVSVPEKGTGRGINQTLERAIKKLDSSVYQLVILDLSAVVEDPRAQAQVEQLIGWLERVQSRNPGTEILCVVPLPAEDDVGGLSALDYRAALDKTWSVARVELAARELDGRQWGRPGPFRSALIRELKTAGDASPLKPLLASGSRPSSFLERGFWRAAEKRKLTDRLQRQVSSDVLDSVVKNEAFRFGFPVVSWPVSTDYTAIVDGFSSGETIARQAAIDAVFDFESHVDQLTPSPWLRGQFKKGGITYSRPLLDYWLMGLSFELFGQSEFTARLPGFVIGFLVLTLLFRLLMRVFNPAIATWSCLVLLTCPLFFAQARSASSELSFVLALMCCLGGLSTMCELRFRSRDLFLVILGTCLAFLAQGMFGVIVTLSTMVVFAFLQGSNSRAIWAVVLAVAVSAAGLSVWLAGQQQWTFWSHFGFDAPLQHWKLGADSRPFNLNFDVLIRQIGFGTAPWLGLIPFGFARLVGTGIDRNKPAAMMVLVWAIVPYVVQSIILKDNNHFVYAATPALAVTVGYLLHSTYTTRPLGTLAAVSAAILIGLLVGNLTKSPEPLTSFLTVDPPLGSGGSAETYPETLKIGLALKMMLVTILVMLVLGPARFGERLRHVVTFLRRSVPFWTLATLALVVLSAYVLMGLEYQLASSFSTAAGRLLEPIHRVFVRSVFYWRPQSLALMLAFVALFALLVWDHTSLFRGISRWVNRWVLTPLPVYSLGILLGLVAVITGLSIHSDLGNALGHLPSFAIATMGTVVGTSVAISFVRTGVRSPLILTIFGLALALYPAAGGSWAVTVCTVIAALLGLGVAKFAKLPAFISPVPCGVASGSLLMAVFAPDGAGVLGVTQFLICFAALTTSVVCITGALQSLESAAVKGTVLEPLSEPLAGMRSLGTLLPIGLVVLAVALDSELSAGLPMVLSAAFALLVASFPAGHFIGQYSDITVRLIASVTTVVAIGLSVIWGTSLFLSFPLGLALAYALKKGAVPVGLGVIGWILAALRGRWFNAPLAGVFALLLVILFSGVSVSDIFAYTAFWVVAAPLVLLSIVALVRADNRFIPGLGFAAAVLAIALRWLIESSPMLALLGYPRPLVPGFAVDLWIAGGLCAAVVIAALIILNTATAVFSRESQAFNRASAVIGLGFLLLGLELSISWGSYSDGFVGWATWQSPLFYVGIPVAFLWMAWSRYRNQPFSLAPMALIGWVIAGCIAQLMIGSDLSTARYVAAGDFTTPAGVLLRNKGLVITSAVLLSVLVGLNSLRHVFKRSPRTAFFSFLGTGLAMVLMLAIPLINKWLHLRESLQTPGAPEFLEYLFVVSRRAWVAYGILLAVIVLGAWPLVSRVFSWIARRNLVQRLRQIQPLLATAVLLLTGGVVGRFLNASSSVLLLGPIMALAFARFLPGWSGGRRLPLLLIRGLGQILLGSLAFFVPALGVLLFDTSQQVTAALFTAGVSTLLLLVVAWVALCVFRLGLGIADVLEELRFVSPTAFLFCVVSAATFYTQLAAGGGHPDMTVGAYVILAIAGSLGIALLANVLAQHIHPLRVSELLEKPRVWPVAVLLVAGGFSVLYGNSHVKALSFHVSQKHILDTVKHAENGSLPLGRIFQHGIGGHSSSNFYTHAIPEIKDKASILRALKGEKNEVLTLTIAGKSVSSYQVAQGFSADNDVDGDGRRDWPADAGVAQSADANDGWLADSTKSWDADQWKGYWLIDSDGWRFPVTRNTSDRIYYDSKRVVAPPTLVAKNIVRKSPAFDARVSARNYYRLDSDKSVNKDATAMAPERIYALLPKIGDHAPAYSDRGSFSDLNSRFRRQAKGRHLAVLDDRSSQILLSTSYRRPGEYDANWIRKAVVSSDEFESMVSEGKIRSYNTKKPLDGVLTWDGKLKFVGYRMDNFTVSRGKKFKLHTYFRVEKPIKKSWKIFMHIDRSGHRIHSDHWPHAVSKGKDGKHCIGCFQTDHWQPGDIVVDTYERSVPFGAPKGETEIFMGFFDPQHDKRMKITSWDNKIVGYKGSDDRARIGSFLVR